MAAGWVFSQQTGFTRTLDAFFASSGLVVHHSAATPPRLLAWLPSMDFPAHHMLGPS
jgi:hypothetical protein